MDTNSNARGRRRSSRHGRGGDATKCGPTTESDSSSNAATHTDTSNAAADAASTSRAPPSSSSSSSRSGRNRRKRSTKKSTSEATGRQAQQDRHHQDDQAADAKRRKLTNKRVVTPSPPSSSSLSTPAKALKNPPVGKSIKEALRQEAQKADAASSQSNDDTDEVDTPPEGVFDLEAMAASNLQLRTVPSSYHSPEAYGNDDTNSYLVSYGRQYYRHLFDFAAQLRDSLATGGEGEDGAATAMRITRAAASGGASTLPRCLARQPDISSVMRAILVDWLAELAHSFKLQDVTLHLSVKLLDRVLCTMNIDRRTFQCLGCACMLIASKLEETQPVTTKDLAYMSDSTYTRSQIKDMEVKVCDLLEFRLQTPTAYHFSGRFISASNVAAGLRGGGPSPPNPILETMVSYLMELSLLEHQLVETPNSLVTAAALYLARATLGIRDEYGHVWNKTLKYYTNYDVEDLEDTVLILHSCQSDADESNLKCVVTHYKHKDRFEVARKPALLMSDLGFSFDAD